PIVNLSARSKDLSGCRIADVLQSNLTGREVKTMNNKSSLSAVPVKSDPMMIWIEGGSFMMGSDRHYREEAPAHRVSVKGFWIDTPPVTHAQFGLFKKATQSLSLAELPANPEDYPGAKAELLAPSSVVFERPRQRVDMTNAYNWWRYVRGADWRHPFGPRS